MWYPLGLDVVTTVLGGLMARVDTSSCVGEPEGGGQLIPKVSDTTGERGRSRILETDPFSPSSLS